METRKSLFFLLLVLCVPGLGRASAGVLQGAVDYATRQRDEAAAELAAAKARLEAATQDVNRGEEALTKARLGRNVVAEGVAKEAIKAAAARVGEAGVPVQQATLALNQGNTLVLRLQAMAGRSLPRALALPAGAVQRFAADGRAVADPLAPLAPGDRIETGSDGSARLFLAAGAAEGTLAAGSRFRLLADAPGSPLRIDLEQGALRLSVQEGLEVHTPAAALSLQEGDCRIETGPAGLRVSVYRGVVTITAPGAAAVRLGAGLQREYVPGKGFGPATALVQGAPAA